MKMCYQESMRRDAPTGVSFVNSMNKDVNVNGVDLKRGEAFFIGIQFI